MRASLLTIFTLSITFIGNAQTFKPTIGIGVATRGYPIPLQLPGNVFFPYDFHYSSSSQFKCKSIALDISTLVFNGNWTFQVSNYFRYNYFREIDVNDYSTVQTVIYPLKLEKRFKTDHIVSLYYKKQGNPRKLKLTGGVGFGVMNTGTGFDYKHFTGFYDNNGKPIFETLHDTFSFFTPCVMVGISYRNLSWISTVYGSKDQHNRPRPTLWIEGKLAYSFRL